jgi:thiamine-phosphate pyrophosphorylase
VNVSAPIICLVTGGRAREQPTLELIAAAARAGVDLIQIRERGMDDRALLDFTQRAVELTRGTTSRVVVNDRADIALAAGASGVHLRANSCDAARVRALAPGGFLIGRSVHATAEAVATAAAGGCDYLIFGTVFSSTSKPANHPVAGLDALRDACRSVQLPVLAIGGIALDNAALVARAGASGIAAISLFERSGALAATVSALRRVFDT